MKQKIGKALVVGAGIGGIRSALDLAETGYKVTLIDRAAHIGGILTQLDYQFPTNRCGMCKMLPLVQRDAGSQFCLRKGLFHDNIEIMTGTQLTALSGDPGHYKARLRKNAGWVNPELCMGCGLCEAVCPVQIADTFNAGLSRRKAIHLPVPHAIANHYVIDAAACTRCGQCQNVCPTGAIEICSDRFKDFRILIVDDELVVRDSLKEWLVNEGFASVDMAESGARALAMLQQAPYQLMLTDIKMPGMDGVELLKLAKESYPDLTVVMMTAYATVETAVEAMKIGALDYFMKPFDPDTMIPLVVKIFQETEAARDLEYEFNSVIVSTGTDYYHPAEGINPYGYGVHPHVLTHIEFERLLSGAGPSMGQALRPLDGKPLRKVAWMQCVGSRDIQMNADFCSSICCMIAIKEALLVKEKTAGSVDTAIFYMDMRTFGKSFQDFADRAAREQAVRFERARIHSIDPDPLTFDPVIRMVRLDGTISQERFDLVVLSVGQRPAKGTAQLAEIAGLELNAWGFVQGSAFAPTRTQKEGVFLSGSASGLKNIGESVIFASAASMQAARAIHAAGGSLADEPAPPPPADYILQEPPRVLTVICTCGGRLHSMADPEDLTRRLRRDPAVTDVVYSDRLCTASGWQDLEQQVADRRPNRLLLGACHPYLFVRKLKDLERSSGLPAGLMDAVDLHACRAQLKQGQPAAQTEIAADRSGAFVTAELLMSLARLKRADPEPLPSQAVCQRALVIGGGIGGMTAALAIADMGYAVDLVEQSDRLGGNLHWIQRTLEGHATAGLLEETVAAISKHPRITVRLESRVVTSTGCVGRFQAIVENSQQVADTIEHGAVIIATGGGEALPNAGAQTAAYGYGSHPQIITQKELEYQIKDKKVDLEQLDTVVMIQCVGSRQEPRNYCSRVCCATCLKHALWLKEQNPQINVYVLYRDIMTYGFAESYFTRAREAGVIFIQYTPEDKPHVQAPQADGRLSVQALEPILNARVSIETDLLVLATGIVPRKAHLLAAGFGVTCDANGFIQEAESKWRPVDTLKEGVFVCGLARAPQTIDETIATAQAAAQRALRIISAGRLPEARLTAQVRRSLCSLCECCIETCPYGARWINMEEQVIVINTAMCQGCGACAAVCPNGAATVRGLAKPQVFEMIDAVFG
jgi:heterodisulfide reductase subunit A